MATFSFDIVSEYDKAEMNNIFAGTEREIGNRYDFKGTPAAIEWLNGDKTGIKIIGANQWQCDAILDVIRKKLAAREQSAKVLDLTKTPQESKLREEAPKAKAQIQGDAVRVTSASKDELQKVITLLKASDYDFPLEFINYR